MVPHRGYCMGIDKGPYLSHQDKKTLNTLGDVMFVSSLHTVIGLSNLFWCAIIHSQWETMVYTKKHLPWIVLLFSTVLVVVIDFGYLVISTFMYACSQNDDSPEVNKLEAYLWILSFLKQKRRVVQITLGLLCCLAIPHTVLLVYLNKDWYLSSNICLSLFLLFVYILWKIYFLFCYLPRIKIPPPSIVEKIKKDMTIPN